MTIEQKENNYVMNRKLEGVKSLLIIIKNDINNVDGAVSEDVISNALSNIIDYINFMQLDIEM